MQAGAGPEGTAPVARAASGPAMCSSTAAATPETSLRPRPASQFVVLPSRRGSPRIDPVLSTPSEVHDRAGCRGQRNRKHGPVTEPAVHDIRDPDHDPPLEGQPPPGRLNFEGSEDRSSENMHDQQAEPLEFDSHSEPLVEVLFHITSRPLANPPQAGCARGGAASGPVICGRVPHHPVEPSASISDNCRSHQSRASRTNSRQSHEAKGPSVRGT